MGSLAVATCTKVIARPDRCPVCGADYIEQILARPDRDVPTDI
jgi:hypothetical protein